MSTPSAADAPVESACVFDTAVFITRYLPYPPDNGAYLYSSQIVRHWAAISRRVHVVGGTRNDASAGVPVGSESNVRVHPTTTQKAGFASYLLSGLPFAALPFRTAGAIRAATDLLQDADCIVLDHLGSSWLLKEIKRIRRATGRHPFLVYIAHNVELDTRLTMASSENSPKERLFASVDLRRIRRDELWLLRNADLVICITEEDRSRLAELGAKGRLTCIVPQFTGLQSDWTLSERTPRRITILGSFGWRTKQRNLVRFLEAGISQGLPSDIEICVVGSAPPEFLTDMRSRFPGVEFTGRVDEVAPYLVDTRIGVVAEKEGGGFKLKLLDYVFSSVAVYSLAEALSGSDLVDGISARMFSDVNSLWRGILSEIDDIDKLNVLRSNARLSFGRFVDDRAMLAKLRQEVNASSFEVH